MQHVDFDGHGRVEAPAFALNIWHLFFFSFFLCGMKWKPPHLFFLSHSAAQMAADAIFTFFLYLDAILTITPSTLGSE